MNVKKMIKTAWKNATGNRDLSALMKTIGETVNGMPEDDGTFRPTHVFHKLAERIAVVPNVHHSAIALDFRSGWSGEWRVTNSDLTTWALFSMWMGRSKCGSMCCEIVDPISRSLRVKRMQQAYDRYAETGLRAEHCRLLENMGWMINTGRGDGVSLYVEGKRPFGNSSIEWDIWIHSGREVDWVDDDMPSEKREQAWDLFDELAFAASDAAAAARKTLEKESV